MIKKKHLYLVILINIFVACDYKFDSSGSFFSENSLFILTSDNMTSAGFAIYHEGSIKNGSADFHTDAVVRAQYPYVYVLNRLGRDNIQILNAQDDYRTVAEISLSKNSSARPNPQDIIFFGERALISCYDTDELMVFNTQTYKIERTIDLTKYGYKGSACPAFMHYDIEKNRVVAALQRLDRLTYLPADYSSVIVLDPDSGEVFQQLRLSLDSIGYRNPYTRFREYDEDSLLIGCAGNFKMTGSGDDDGGIIILQTGDTYSVEGVLLKEGELGADIVDFVYDGTLLYLITLDVYGVSALVSFDPINSVSQILKRNSNGKGYLWRVELRDDLLYICNRDVTDAGILIYDTVKKRFLFGGGLTTGLPPADMAFIDKVTF